MAAEKGTILEASIYKKLKGFQLDVRFQAGTGCLGILGPSGCGKSMTLKSIAGIVRPDKGSIRILGPDGSRIFYDSRTKTDQKPQKRKVGYLFQDYALFPNMTVEENIAIGLQNRKKTSRPAPQEIKKKAAEMAERFQLKGLEKRYPRQLSGGQQQRTALARIMAYEPDILLLDEPFSAMDSYLREGLRLELSRMLKDYGGISILVTHDRDEAYQLCSRLLLMDRGKIVAEGDTKTIFADPVTVQAARLTGCKNISRIKRLGEYEVEALDWKGLKIRTSRPVGQDIQAVGIRAHDLEPIYEVRDGETFQKENWIPVKDPIVWEMPFEWYITLGNGLWWKREKNIHTHDIAGVIPAWMKVRPEAVLLLKDE